MKNVELKYFRILCNFLSGSEQYTKLLEELYYTPFICLFGTDRDREQDGLDLRSRLLVPQELEQLRDKECSVLEVMVALSLRCENHIMDNPLYGDRTSSWFWGMIHSLGLDAYDDYHFKKFDVSIKIYRFLYRLYRPDGKGGLFTVKKPKADLRDVEIWYQMCWYLNEVLDEERKEKL